MGNVRSTNKVYSTPAIKLVSVKVQFTIPVAPSSAISIDYYPPEGKTGKNTQLTLWSNSIPGATSGTHYFSVASNVGQLFMYGESVYSTHLRFAYGFWLNADVLTYPTDQVSATIMSTNLKFSDDKPLALTYFNASDGSQAAAVYFSIDYEEVSK